MTDENAQAVILLAKSKLRNGESFLMVEGFDDALNYFEATQDTSVLLDIYQLAAIKMRWLNHQDAAAVYLTKAVDIASSSTNPTRSELLIELSNLYAKPSLKKDYPKALSYAVEAMQAARTNEERARALHDIGLFHSFIGNNDSASIYMEKALAEIEIENPLFTQYALNYANNPSADFKRCVAYLNRIKSQSLGILITLGFIHLNHARKDSARYYMDISKSLYNENPDQYSINTYNNLRLLEQSLGLLDKGKVEPYEGTVTNDSINEIMAIQSKISQERRDYNNRLQIQLLQAKTHRQFLLSIGLGIILCLTIGFGMYVWSSKRKFLKLKQQLDNVKVEQIVVEANEGESDKSLDLVRRRMNICIDQFRVARVQTYLDNITVQYRNTGNYPSVKERETIQKKLIGCFADFIVDLKMTGIKLNMEDILTCILSCLKESNATIAACLGSTDTAVRTRKSRLRAKLPAEMLNLLGL
ncbi:MAG: hypothetical protein K2K05_04660 [Muribaculaceae bacterium]|nr:hypothetical protein [Muribaculaceae bacterium]